MKTPTKEYAPCRDAIVEAKIQRFLDQTLIPALTADRVPLAAEFAHAKDPVPLKKSMALERRPVAEGEKWGETFESGYFKLAAIVPEAWDGAELVAHLNFGGEALLYDEDGIPRYAVTNQSIFDNHFSKDLYLLPEPASAGERVTLYAEAVSTGLWGVERDRGLERQDPRRHGYFESRLRTARLCRWYPERWDLYMDMEVLLDLYRDLEENTVRKARILRALNAAVNAWPKGAEACRAVLAPELAKPAEASSLATTAVGHAHIDTGWLWRISEGIRKCARTFASQLTMIDRYPGYVFGASQAQHYLFIKQGYPELYERIGNAVKDGRWELQGGMWVEADCNLISGESMVRQFLHGKQFFMDEFGIDVRNCWIPDVFGYSGNLPQIMKKAGCDVFFTQKMSWSQFNRMPHTTFMWEGIDGSRVLTHFSPEDNYNSLLTPNGLRKGVRQFVEKDRLDEFLTPFGIGDGGGGPNERFIERGFRARNMEGLPRVSFGTAASCFEELLEHADELDSWRGELYLEIHRGTLTTQARTKRYNRKVEIALKQTEALCACGDPSDYPRAELDRMWKQLLVHQFHDILPGSSIHAVYEEAEAAYRDILDRLAELQQASAKRMMTPAEDGVTLFNTLSCAYTAPVNLPEDWAGCAVMLKGKPLPAQSEDGVVVVRAVVPPSGFVTLRKGDAVENAAASASDGLVLENDLVRYVLNKDAQLIEAVDKETGRSLLPEGECGNVLSLYGDTPHLFDAWDIDFCYPEQWLETARGESAERIADGPVRQGVRFILRVGEASTLEQTAYLAAHSKRLDFETRADWRECEKMLRVAFPTTVETDMASSEIQYGVMRRPTHWNTSWDKARFETAAHRYVDLSDEDRGVALLNDCKYGHRIHRNVIDLALLRSPVEPDPEADQGAHEFTYSLLPHRGRLTESNVRDQAAMLNEPPLRFSGYAADALASPVVLEGEGLSLEALKMAEKSDRLVVRVVETQGRRNRGTLRSIRGAVQWIETDLMEWHEQPLDKAEALDIECGPFEIKTYLVAPNKN